MKYRLPNTLSLSSYGRNIDIKYVSSKECSIDLDSDLVGINSISAVDSNPIIFKLNNFGDTRNLCVDTDALYCDKTVSGNIADYTLGKSNYWFNTSYIDNGNFNNLEVSSTANITSVYCRDVTANIIFTDDMYITDLYVNNVLPQSIGSSNVGSYSEYFDEVHATSLMLHSVDDDRVMYRIQVLTRSMESTLEIYSATDINATLNGLVDLDLPYGMKISTQTNYGEQILLDVDSQEESINFKAPTTKFISNQDTNWTLLNVDTYRNSIDFKSDTCSFNPYNNKYLHISIDEYGALYSMNEPSFPSESLTVSGLEVTKGLNLTDILFKYTDLTTQGTITTPDNFYGTINIKKGAFFYVVICYNTSIMANLGLERIYFSGTPLSNIVSFLSLQNPNKDKFHLGLAISLPKPSMISASGSSRTLVYLYKYLRNVNVNTYRPFDNLDAVILDSIDFDYNAGTDTLVYFRIPCIYNGDTPFNLTVDSGTNFEIVVGGYIAV